jgi:hypothetical protein
MPYPTPGLHTPTAWLGLVQPVGLLTAHRMPQTLTPNVDRIRQQPSLLPVGSLCPPFEDAGR